MLFFFIVYVPKNANEDLWWFPDHESWVPIRVNSGSKKCMITELKLMLNKFGFEEKFKEGGLIIYLELKEPLTLYGQLIHNILKREIIHPKRQRKDEMWFGFGKLKALFGQEEYFLYSGLKMGQLPEGFANNNEVPKDSMLIKIFKGKKALCRGIGVLNKRLSQLRGEANKKGKGKRKEKEREENK
ncbi:hypothetical protein Ddye_026051 [Dipteronia dyeriana]|uniref:Uncharacterized protein n=1 Tax=Dipteronia dyeriana TaxID=168575 RepID=A0AAD9TM01_9ROSI|nr:hypothetical protein Ddye_026051 [Dipteronia dyeriana]